MKFNVYYFNFDDYDKRAAICCHSLLELSNKQMSNFFFSIIIIEFMQFISFFLLRNTYLKFICVCFVTIIIVKNYWTNLREFLFSYWSSKIIRKINCQKWKKLPILNIRICQKIRLTWNHFECIMFKMEKKNLGICWKCMTVWQSLF